MCKNSILKQILFGAILVFFVSCDKDFNEIGTNIIGDDHFDFQKYTNASVVAYNQNLGPVATNNLEINPFGIYNNPVFGTTNANFVTQLELATPNPTFTNIQNPPVIDSVVLHIPYFSTVKETSSNGDKIYKLDSIFGQSLSKMKLSVYESGYFLRNLDPSQQLGEPQLFYSDKNSEINSYKIGQRLNNSTNTKENDQFFFSSEELKEKVVESNGTEKINKLAPGMRLHLNKDFFTGKIINAPSGQLYNNNIFKNYFRGLYFKLEHTGTDSGNMAMVNFRNGKITVYYKQDNSVTVNNVTTVERISKNIVLNLSGNSVSLLDNSNTNINYTAALNSANPVLGDEKLFLKGGEGSMAVIDLFGPDADNNGIADELEVIKSNGWLINEASLTFYVDRDAMSDAQTIEPQRILLYDLKNKRALVDYLFDITTNAARPKLNKGTFGGILEKEKVANGRGIKYKIRITNHVRNLIKKDSTNVRLGLSVTESINNLSLSKLKTPVSSSFNSAPTMSVLSPLGTVLYGSRAGTNVPEDKRLKLEIYYTKPN
jgi:hypothetical protein